MPNKKYAKPEEDPVFKTTKFVRGQTATFGCISEPKVAFWVFRAIDYANYLKNRISDYYNKKLVLSIESASIDIYEAQKCFENKGWKFPNKEAQGKSVKEILEIFGKHNKEILEKHDEKINISIPESKVNASA